MKSISLWPHISLSPYLLLFFYYIIWITEDLRLRIEKSSFFMEKCNFSLPWPEQPHLVQFHEFNYSPFILPWPPQASTSIYGNGNIPSSTERTGEEERSLSASKSHSEAEKRRRERINGHLSTLRHLIPSSDKMDKAALLGSVVDQVKELKRKAVELGKEFTVPTDVDQVLVNDCDSTNVLDHHTSSKDCLFLKASLCCDDRPELFADLIGALKGLKLRTVRVEMATLGGRMMSVMVLSTSKDGDQKSVCLSTLKQSVKVVLSRVASLSMGSTAEFSSKRRRTFLSSN